MDVDVEEDDAMGVDMPAPMPVRFTPQLAWASQTGQMQATPMTVAALTRPLLQKGLV
jgi:hypothetical protein